MNWKHVRMGLALLAILGWAVPGRAQSPAADPLRELTKAADLVFRGTVLKPGAANLEIVEPNDKTAVVRVDEILAAAGTLDDFTGREITVFLRDASAKAGEQGVFFTTVALLGESLGVVEVGRRGPEVPRSQVAAAREQLRAEGVRARMEASGLAVSGRVVSVKAAAKADGGGVITEHDPQWREAVVEVRTVLRGQLAEKTVSVWFPGSQDVMWAQAPKLEAGREGTWLLHRHEAAGRGPVWAVLDPQDQLSDEEAGIAGGGTTP
ncbi:MAG TPA: hypothetical protein VF789_06615 [Thermoanaerobaculia bacterium]